MHSYVQADSRQASTQACIDVTHEGKISKVHFLIHHTRSHKIWEAASYTHNKRRQLPCAPSAVQRKNGCMVAASRQAGRQADRQTGRQTGKQTGKH